MAIRTLRDLRTAWKARVLPAVLAAVGCIGSVAQVCVGPPELEARARSTADESGYAELGTWFGQREQFGCANEAFRASLRLNPGSAKVNYFLGVSLYSSGEKEAALVPLGRSAELDATTALPHVLMATVLGELGRRPEAEEQWKAVLKIDPASQDALDGLSKALMADHDFFAAIELLRPADRDEELTLDLASAYGQSGRLAEAEATVKEGLAKMPGSIRLTKALATVYVHQHRYQDATVLLRGYLAEHPADEEAEIQYLSILVLTNDVTTARPLGTKLLAAMPHSFDVLYLNGVLERESEEYAAARDHLTEAVKLQPENYTAHYNLGAALFHLNDTAGAKAELVRAIALDGTQSEAHFQLAAVLRSMKDAPGAQRELAIFQRLKKESDARAESESKAEQARQKLAAGDTAQAVALYRVAVAATPGNALLQYQLATALDQAGDVAGERGALEAAVKIDPTFALAQNQLGYLLSRTGEAAKAEQCFRAAVKAAPAFTEAWVNLAATLAAQSRFAEAREAVATVLRLDPKNAQALELDRQMAKL